MESDFYTLSTAPTCRFHIPAAPTLERGRAVNIKAAVWRDIRLAQGHRSSLTSWKFDKTFLRNARARSKPGIGYLQRRGCLATHKLEEFTHEFGAWLGVGRVQVTVACWTPLTCLQSLLQVGQIYMILHFNCFLVGCLLAIVNQAQLASSICPLSPLNENKVKPKSITFDEQCLVWLPYLSLCRAL